jgi:hypothetical protein
MNKLTINLPEGDTPQSFQAEWDELNQLFRTENAAAIDESYMAALETGFTAGAMGFWRQLGRVVSLSDQEQTDRAQQQLLDELILKAHAIGMIADEDMPAKFIIKAGNA